MRRLPNIPTLSGLVDVYAYSVAQAAYVLGEPEEQVRAWLQEGALRALPRHKGRHTRILGVELRRLRERQMAAEQARETAQRAERVRQWEERYRPQGKRA